MNAQIISISPGQARIQPQPLRLVCEACEQSSTRRVCYGIPLIRCRAGGEDHGEPARRCWTRAAGPAAAQLAATIEAPHQRRSKPSLIVSSSSSCTFVPADHPETVYRVSSIPLCLFRLCAVRIAALLGYVDARRPKESYMQTGQVRTPGPLRDPIPLRQQHCRGPNRRRTSLQSRRRTNASRRSGFS